MTLAVAEWRLEREASWGTYATEHYRCRYFVWGDGPPVLFIPGLADDARSFIFLTAHLADRFRCIAYDLPCGREDNARLESYTHDRLVQDAWQLLDHLGISRTYIFGSSFGSTIALAAARQRPDRVPRLILQGGFARRPLAPAEVLLARLARRWPGTLHALPFRRAMLRRCHYGPFAGLPPEIWNYFLARSNGFPIRALAYRALWLHQIDLRAMLGEIRQPVLLVCGECDPLVGRACEAQLLECLPNAGRIELAGCGHNPLFTHPAELAEAVAAFLTPPPAACPAAGSSACH